MALFSDRCTLCLRGSPVTLTVERSKRRRRTIAFKIEDDGAVRAFVPWRTGTKSLQKALDNCENWIVREQRRRKNRPLPFTEGSIFPVLGHACIVTVRRGVRGGCDLFPHELRVCVAEGDLSEEALRQETRLDILLWMKRMARKKLRQRLDLWARRLDVQYARFVLTDPEQRWGSCSVDNVIRLNWRLMMASPRLVDYVVAHELVHIRHKDHSVRFWRMLAEVMPDVKFRRNALRALEKDLFL
ncbi:MAG: SprT family zinc-dependent metalloprotease [Alphaproteobacteria bacterium]|nr:SprT family zinc-dependent metalloprotease [Alphaproteobacteria bacterium]